MRKIVTLFFALAIFVPLAACGGGDETDSSSDSSSEDEETTTTSGDDESDDESDDDEASPGGSNEDSDYCNTLNEILELGEGFDEDFDFTDEDQLEIVLNAFEDLGDAADDDDIKDDFDTVSNAFQVFVDATEDAGDDPEDQAAAFEDPEVAQAFEDSEAAGERIDIFSLEQCGITLDGESADAESSDSDDSSDDSGTGSDSGEDTSLVDFADDVDACEGGDMEACDVLYGETPFDSEAEAVALECGGEDPGGEHQGDCVASFG